MTLMRSGKSQKCLNLLSKQNVLFWYFSWIETNRRTYPGTNYVAVHKNGRTYHLFDASRIPYGKMCVRIAKYLCGKHSPLYKNNQNGISDVCVIVNACDMLFTGKKIN